MAALARDAAVERTRQAVDRMPLLRELVVCLKADGFAFKPNVRLFGVQHLMAQALAFCWALNELGLPYGHIALCGKSYSTNLSVRADLESLGVMVQPQRRYCVSLSHNADLVDDIRNLARDFSALKAGVVNPGILVLDDGGLALSHLSQFIVPPFRIAGVEQTASGAWQMGARSVDFPVVDVGTSGVKRACEPLLVADAALSRILPGFNSALKEKRVGIIGLGYIGEALASRLAADGYDVIAYDDRPDACDQFAGAVACSVEDVFQRSDIIFGCTGNDTTLGIEEWNLPPRERTLISLSSGDVEFFSLKFLLISHDNGAIDDTYGLESIPDISGVVLGSSYKIFRNGFPANFDNSLESVPLEHIQGTLAALLGAVRQAHGLLQQPTPSRRVALDLDFQTWLLQRWQRLLPSGSIPLDVELEPEEIRERLRILTAWRSECVETEPAFGDWVHQSVCSLDAARPMVE